MKHLGTLISVTAAALLVTACGTAGYYDSEGRWHPYQNTNTAYQNPVPGGMPGTSAVVTEDVSGDYTVAPPAGTTTVIQYHNAPAYSSAAPAYNFSRAGVYDYNGYYISSGPQVPSDYWPPRGMCRVWFADRVRDQQPPVEACDGIQGRIPVGAYIVFGG